MNDSTRDYHRMGVMFACREGGENTCEILTQQCGKVYELVSCVLCVVEETLYSGMFVTKFLFVIIALHLCQGAFERDLLLTPKEGLQIIGKKIYYRPDSNETNGRIPWEQTLKHVTYLTLFNDGESDAKISDHERYKQFMQSPYTRIHDDYPKFGDIITMARGRVENLDGYRFIEGVCDQHCNESVLALWRVQKIRHRDSQRGFRYEMKFSVTPLKDSISTQNRIPNGEQYFKSFILKDDDYPESFSTLKRRSDSVEIFSNERQARIVNEIPSKGNPNTQQLNIGEYFKNDAKATPKVGYHSGVHNIFPTTYRPSYHVKFSKPETFKPLPEEPKTVVTHHFHHHYFMNEPESHLLKEQQAFLGNADAIRIIEPPNAEVLAAQYARLHTTTASSSPSKVFYMHTIPILKQATHQEEPTTTYEQLIPFRQSEQQIEKIRYSDPDPLYENEGISSLKVNSETASAEVYPQVERPQTIIEPHIISSEFFQSEENREDVDSGVPIADVVQESTTSQPKPRPTKRVQKAKNYISMLTEKPRVYVSKVSIDKFRTYGRSTTEKPVLKWKPKRKPTEKPSEQQSNEGTQQDVVTVTPSNIYATDFEILTKKSVSKSISVKVGNYSQEIPLREPFSTSIDIPKTVEHEGDSINR